MTDDGGKHRYGDIVFSADAKARYGEDLIELFRGSGEEADEEATITLLSKLRSCVVLVVNELRWTNPISHVAHLMLF